jgi:hypothetical protein
MKQKILSFGILLSSIALMGQNRKIDFSIFAGSNYSCITQETNGQPVINVGDGPRFDFGFQFGGKAHYSISELFTIQSGVRIEKRISKNGFTKIGSPTVNSMMSGVGIVNELLFVPRNSKLGLVAGINFEKVLWASINLPSLNNQNQNLISPIKDSKTEKNIDLWFWSIGCEYHLSNSIIIGIQYERLLNNFDVLDTRDPSVIGIKNNIIKSRPQSIYLNINYKF